MKGPLIRCDNCGIIGFKIYSYHAGSGNVYHYCSMICKKEMMKRLEEVQDEVVEEETGEESVLPEMRSFIAHKTNRGITVMRGYCGIYRESDSGESGRDRSSSGRREEQE